jgi:hypothetical protein
LRRRPVRSFPPFSFLPRPLLTLSPVLSPTAKEETAPVAAEAAPVEAVTETPAAAATTETEAPAAAPLAVDTAAAEEKKEEHKHKKEKVKSPGLVDKYVLFSLCLLFPPSHCRTRN